jgi:hypothetical protein
MHQVKVLIERVEISRNRIKNLKCLHSYGYLCTPVDVKVGSQRNGIKKEYRLQNEFLQRVDKYHKNRYTITNINFSSMYSKWVLMDGQEGQYHADTKENKVRVACIKVGVTSEATKGFTASAMK